MSFYQEVTHIYPLPSPPEGWHWKVWKDRIDNHPKVLIRLSDEVGHARGSAIIDVGMYGDGTSVLERAGSILRGATA